MKIPPTYEEDRNKEEVMRKIKQKVWWGRGDSNPHASQHQILSLARLPIPALPHTPRANGLYWLQSLGSTGVSSV